jgi:hypothetical protein
MAAGTHVLRLEIDAAGTVVEASETDNFYTRELVIVEVGESAPVLSLPVRLPDGNFRFTLNGAPLGKYEIQASTNLPSWNVFGPPLELDATGVGVVTDLSAANSARKLYRSRLLPD